MCLYVTAYPITEVIPKIDFPPYICIRNHGIHSFMEFRATNHMLFSLHFIHVMGSGFSDGNDLHNHLQPDEATQIL